MPAFSIGAALAVNHFVGGWRHALGGLHALIALAFLGAGLVLSGPTAAAATLCVLALAATGLFSGSYYVGIQVLSVLAVAHALICFEERRQSRALVMLVLALSAALLVRSSVRFLPLLLALREVRRPEGTRKLAFALLLPYAALIPWLCLQRVHSQQWLLFEADGPLHGPLANLVTAVFGLDQCVEGDFRPLMGDAAAWGTAAPYAWAAASVLRHPAAYAAGVARRLWLVGGWHPILVGLACAGFWRRRGEAPYRALGLLTVYFCVVHCAMSIQRSYLVPLWPLLALLAGGLARVSGDRERRASLGRAAGWIPLAFLTALGLFAEARILAYVIPDEAGAQGLAESRVDALLQRSPKMAWLLAQKGRARARAGDWAAARAYLSWAAAERPRFYGVEAARAAIFAGDPSAALALDERGDRGFRIACAKVSAWLQLGREDSAREQLRRAFEVFDSKTIFFRDRDSPAVRLARDRMSRNAGAFVHSVWRWESNGPAPVVFALSGLLLEASPRAAWLWVERARVAESLGRRDAALVSLRAAAALGPDEEERASIEAALRRLGT
jgi:tetratricopeptide (TPR) repeat protein